MSAIPPHLPRRALVAGMALALANAAAPALAQDAAEDLEEIVVTGRFQNSLTNRIPVTVEELPFSLETLSRDLMDQQSFLRPLDIVTTLPNVAAINHSTSIPASEYVIRGVYASKLTNSRPQSFSRGSGERDDSFIETVEVLKGPPSIILGPAIPGGIINIITKTPAQEDFFALEQTFDSFGMSVTQVDLNQAELFGSDAVRGRLMGSYRVGDGQADGDEANNFAIRGVIEGDIGERTRVQASAAYTDVDVKESVAAFPLYEDGTIPSVFGPTTSVGGGGAPQSGEDVYVDGELQHDFLDNLKLIVRGSYQDTSFKYRDFPGVYNYAGPGILFSDPVVYYYHGRGHFDERVTYLDAQLAGRFTAFGQSNDWVIGVTTQRTEADVFTGYNPSVAIPLADLRNPGLPPVDYSQIDEVQVQDTDVKLSSVYAELALRPTSRVTILTGLRYDDVENKDFDTFDPDYPNSPPNIQKVDDVTFRVGVSAELTSSVHGYVSYAQSFLPQTGLTRSGLVGPETAENYELGLKARVGRMELNAAVFDLTLRNRATSDPTNDFGEFFVVGTGEEQHRGFEVSASGEIGDGFTLTAAYGYVDAEVTKDNDGLQGSKVVEVPDYTFSLFGQYEFQGGLEGLRVGAGVRGLGKRAMAPDNVIGTFPGYEVVDALVGYRFNETFDLQLNIYNVLDDEYIDSIGFGGGLVGGYTFAAPLSASLTARLRF